MNDGGLHSLMAETILVIHFSFVAFVVFGFMLILLGQLAQWSWFHIGAALERQLGAQPIWLSTSGLGVFWLHISLDSWPKYFTHEPYRNL